MVDVDQILRFALALLFVLGLIGGLALLGRRMGFAPRVTSPVAGRARRRLGVVEILSVDAKRKLLLIRRDDREHLILLGAGHDLVVESGLIPPPAPPADHDLPVAAAEPTPFHRLLGRLGAPGARTGRLE